MQRRFHANLFIAAVALCSLACAEAAAGPESSASTPIAHHKSKRAIPGSPVTAGPFVVETRTMRYVPASSDDPGGRDGEAWARGSITMPFVVGGPPGVAARMNDVLYLDTLRTAAPAEPGPGFTPPHEAAASGLAYHGVSFRVLRGDARVLSIQFEFEQCGMQCSTFTQNKHFDVATGRPLRMDDLLTPQGLAAIAKRRAQAGMATFEKMLEILPPEPEPESEPADDDATPASAAQPPAVAPDEPTIDEQRNFYRGCYARWEAHDLSSDRAMDVELAKGTLVLDLPMCAGGLLVERALGLAPDPVTMPVKELVPLLTDYGRAVVLGRGDAPLPERRVGPVLHGHVGTAAITLYVDDSSGPDLDGLYYYDRYRLPIPIHGQVRAQALTLDEVKDKGFALRIDGRRLIGNWHGSGKTLPVELE